jgi:carboxylesterase
VKWQEWPEKVTKELRELEKICDTIFLIGLSMGGGTVLNVAESNNNVIKGMVLVNPWIHLPGITVELSFLASRFRKMRSSVGGDIKRPGISEFGYDATPMRGVSQNATSYTQESWHDNCSSSALSFR